MPRQPPRSTLCTKSQFLLYVHVLSTKGFSEQELDLTQYGASALKTVFELCLIDGFTIMYINYKGGDVSPNWYLYCIIMGVNNRCHNKTKSKNINKILKTTFPICGKNHIFQIPIDISKLYGLGRHLFK